MTSAAVVAIDTSAARRKAESQAERLTLIQAVAGAVGDQVQRSMDSIAAIHRLGFMLMLDLLDDADDVGVDGEVRRHLREIASGEQFGVLRVSVVDPDGVVTWSTVPDVVGTDLSDHEHVRVHLQGRREAYISAPFTSSTPGRWSFHVTRPALQEDGRLAGIVEVSVDPDLLARELGVPKVTVDAAAALLRTDGIVLARSGGSVDLVGARVAYGELARMLASPTGASRMVTGLTRMSANLAWQSLAPLPLIVTVTTAATDREPLSDRRLLMVATVSASLLAGLAFGLVAALRARHRERLTGERAEAAQRELAELLDALPGAAYRVIMHAAADRAEVLFGGAIARILDMPAVEPGDGDVLDGRLSPTTRTLRQAMFAEAARSGAGALEYQVVSASNVARWVRDECRRVRVLAADGVELVGAVTDITADRELRAKAMYAANLATLGEMATGIAHELSQPSAAIALAADVAALSLENADADGVDAARQRLARIADQAVRIRTIIDHLQTFGRADTGPLGPVDVGAAVGGALRIAGGTLRNASTRLSVEVAPGLPSVRGRLIPLEQAIVNLLMNARDAMETLPPGERVIEVKAMMTSRGVQLAVRDRGAGVDDSVADRVFEPFFTTKGPGKGTGLGLATVYGTLAAFGASIALRNRSEPPGAEAVIMLQPWRDPIPGHAGITIELERNVP
jgi:C4-dicarboxylate-specific signal transduction histidine kinase